MVTITDVAPRSRAMRAGICPGDRLLSINGGEIGDVLDYRFYLCDTTLLLTLEGSGGRFDVTIKKAEYDDIGLRFATPLMDQKRSCHNKCIFCFIDQLPPGLRDSLYFKDDDARLSFLHGNYITLTNLSDHDIERIIRMHISPVNVSVHTTNPLLRVKMMKNPRAGTVLSYLPRLARAGIRICAQIVLCRGVNDGEELDRTLRDLAALVPAVSSVSVVPAGLSDHRDGLYPLSLFTPEECAGVLRQINSFGDTCKKTMGTRLVYPADEFYISAGLPVPDMAYYEDFEQIENGVGMVAMLGDEFRFAFDRLAQAPPSGGFASIDRSISLATGRAAFPLISGCLDLLKNLCYNLDCRVYEIENRFFGRNITVAGLLTGRDVAAQLATKPLGNELLLPGSMLRTEGDVFLDGMSPDQLAESLGVPVRCVPCSGEELLHAVLGTVEP